MGGVRSDQNCYAGDSAAHYIADSLTFPHTSIKSKVFIFMLLRESFLLNPPLDRILKLYSWDRSLLLYWVSLCLVQYSQNKVPKYLFQASSQGKVRNLLRLPSFAMK